MDTVEVVQQQDGTFEACKKNAPGSPYVGRGKTWEQALGSWFILNQSLFKFFVVVKDKHGKPWVRFSKKYRRS